MTSEHTGQFQPHLPGHRSLRNISLFQKNPAQTPNPAKKTEERLRYLGLISLEKSIPPPVPMRRPSRRWRQALCSVARQEKRHKLKRESFRLDIRRSCFLRRTVTVKQWDRGPEGLCPHTGGFKTRLNEALSSLCA